MTPNMSGIMAAGALGRIAPPASSILSSLVEEIHQRISSIDDRQENIATSVGRLLDPRPAPPAQPSGGVIKPQERPASLEGELTRVLSRLNDTLQNAEEIAARLSTAI